MADRLLDIGDGAAEREKLPVVELRNIYPGALVYHNHQIGEIHGVEVEGLANVFVVSDG